MIISTFFYLGYKLNDKDVQIMARCNAGEITREEADSKACGSLYCCRLEGPEKDKRKNKAYQNAERTASDEIFYSTG